MNDPLRKLLREEQNWERDDQQNCVFRGCKNNDKLETI